MSTRTTISGPLFDGTASREVTKFLDSAKEEVAQETLNEVQSALSSVLKHPTGKYRSNIQTEKKSDDIRVTDGGVVYGSWLEGVSSRNSSTRFKGYATFRKVAQRMQAKAAQITEAALPKFLERMK